MLSLTKIYNINNTTTQQKFLLSQFAFDFEIIIITSAIPHRSVLCYHSPNGVLPPHSNVYFQSLEYFLVLSSRSVSPHISKFPVRRLGRSQSVCQFGVVSVAAWHDMTRSTASLRNRPTQRIRSLNSALTLDVNSTQDSKSKMVESK